MSAASHGVDLVRELVGGGEYYKLASAAIVAVLLCFAGMKAMSQVKKKKNPLIPEEKFGVVLIFEGIAEFLTRLGDMVMGEENRKYLPFIATIFTYILFMNLFGLVPGFVGPTDDVRFNAGMAVTVFVMYTYWGIREVGIVAYLKHLCGPAIFPITFTFSWKVIFSLGIWLFEAVVHIAIFAVEVISHMFRPVSLSLRLFGNMSADHALLAVFTELTPFAVPVIFYFLGIFVCFMQAFVFSMLTMIYIRLAVAHDEGEEH